MTVDVICYFSTDEKLNELRNRAFMRLKGFS